MTTLIAVLLIGGSAVAAIFYHYRFSGLSIEKARIKKQSKEGKSREQTKKTRLNKTAIKVILVALAIILLPITLATAFFGAIWYLISTNLSGGILLLIGYWWILVVALVTRSLYHKLGVTMVVGAIGALIPPLSTAVMGIRQYLHTRYELALQEVKEEVSGRDEEERVRVDAERRVKEEQRRREREEAERRSREQRREEGKQQWQDYYEILQVHHSAEPEVIEAAYRKLAQKYHPDVDPSPKATETMKKINIAHDVLRDPVKRREYDREWREKSQ